MIEMYAKVEGDKEIQRKIEILAEKNIAALRGVITKSCLVVEGKAKKNAPVVFNRLRSSITHEVKKEGKGYMGKVGTDVKYAPAVEFGTKPHLAPIAAEYARKYGIPVPKGKDYVVIKVSGKAQPFLFPALKESKSDIINFLTNAIKAVK